MTHSKGKHPPGVAFRGKRSPKCRFHLAVQPNVERYLTGVVLPQHAKLAHTSGRVRTGVKLQRGPAAVDAPHNLYKFTLQNPLRLRPGKNYFQVQVDLLAFPDTADFVAALAWAADGSVAVEHGGARTLVHSIDISTTASPAVAPSPKVVPAPAPAPTANHDARPPLQPAPLLPTWDTAAFTMRLSTAGLHHLLQALRWTLPRLDQPQASHAVALVVLRLLERNIVGAPRDVDESGAPVGGGRKPTAPTMRAAAAAPSPSGLPWPLSIATAGPTVGKSHADTTPFTTSSHLKAASAAAAAFQQRGVRVIAVDVWHTRYVHALQLTYGFHQSVAGDDPQRMSTPVLGGPTGDCVHSRLVLAPNETIVKTRVKCGALIDRLELETSLGRVKHWGGTGGNPHDLFVPSNHAVVGFHGGSGGHLHNIGVLMVPLDAAPPGAALVAPPASAGMLAARPLAGPSSGSLAGRSMAIPDSTQWAPSSPHAYASLLWDMESLLRSTLVAAWQCYGCGVIVSQALATYKALCPLLFPSTRLRMALVNKLRACATSAASSGSDDDDTLPRGKHAAVLLQAVLDVLATTWNLSDLVGSDDGDAAAAAGASDSKDGDGAGEDNDDDDGSDIAEEPSTIILEQLHATGAWRLRYGMRGSSHLPSLLELATAPNPAPAAGDVLSHCRNAASRLLLSLHSDVLCQFAKGTDDTTTAATRAPSGTHAVYSFDTIIRDGRSWRSGETATLRFTLSNGNSKEQQSTLLRGVAMLGGGGQYTVDGRIDVATSATAAGDGAPTEKQQLARIPRQTLVCTSDRPFHLLCDKAVAIPIGVPVEVSVTFHTACVTHRGADPVLMRVPRAARINSAAGAQRDLCIMTGSGSSSSQLAGLLFSKQAPGLAIVDAAMAAPTGTQPAAATPADAASDGAAEAEQADAVDSKVSGAGRVR